MAVEERWLRMVERSGGPHRWTVKIPAVAALLAGLVAPVVANARASSPVVPFLLKPGDVRGITPGKAQVFRTASAVKDGAGEFPAKAEVSRYESEGFVEAALVRLHDRDESAVKGISSVFEFETAAGARAEMKAELKEALDLPAMRKKGMLIYLILRRFKVPGVPKAVAFAFLPDRAADELGLEAGVGSGLFTRGSYLFKVGIFRPTSNEVVEPVISGVQAISRRTAGSCP